MIWIKRANSPLVAPPATAYAGPMFTIEHDFDHTVITLIDEGEEPRAEDAIVMAFEDCVVIEQLDPLVQEPLRISLSIQQIKDLAAALHLPEGVYPRKAG